MPSYQSSIYEIGGEPDNYNPMVKSIYKYPRPTNEFVISREEGGKVLSKYMDDCWDLSPYKLTLLGNNRIHFKSWSTKDNDTYGKNVECYKWLIFIIIYLAPNQGSNSIKSVGTVISYSALIRTILKTIEHKEYSLFDFIQSESLMKNELSSFPAKALRILPCLLSCLIALGEKRTGFKPINKEFVLFLAHHTPGNYEEIVQTAVIPSRLYSKVITVLNSKLELILEHKDNLLNFIETVQRDRLLGRSETTQYEYFEANNCGKPRNYRPTFNKAIGEFQLAALFYHFNVKSMIQLGSFIKLIQNIVRIQIHIFSGMRRSEVISLKYDCLKEDVYDGKKFYFLEGVTTKLSRSAKKSRWIIAPEAIDGINICKQITASVAAACNLSNPNSLYLFTNVKHIGRTFFSIDTDSVSSFQSSQELTKLLQLFEGDLVIQEEDLTELNMLSPTRNWSVEEKYKLGKTWPLATHQFRRSLAFYIAQSGLVSLPSLKQQLKHLTNQMTLFYAKGSGAQLSFFMQDNKEHFIAEINSVKPVADALFFIKDILGSTERLEGASGRYIEKYYKGENIPPPHIIKREEIIKRFKEGIIAYTPTPLGACLSTTQCNKRALRAVSACIDCDKAVIKPSKLENTIIHFESFVKTLQPSSIEYKFEHEQLLDLKRMQNYIRRRQ